MKIVKKILLYTIAAIMIVGSLHSSVHAADCSATNVTDDACYELECTGQSTEDSASCNSYATAYAIKDDNGDTSCASINSNNDTTCCDNAVDSPMCIAYQNYTSKDANKESKGLTAAEQAALDALNGLGKGGKFVPGGTAAANQPLNIHLQNPLSGISTIPDAINKILGVVIRIALPLIIIMFIWSGLSFVFAQGNQTKITTAKNIFLYTVIGTLLILGAWVITNAIIGTVNAIIT